MSFWKNLFGSAEPTPEISVTDLAALMGASPRPRLIDVRTPGEYASGHAAHAETAPLQQLGGLVAGLDLPKEAPVYLICQSGGRSMRACQMLRKQGFDAVNVRGGTGAWMRAGLPTER